MADNVDITPGTGATVAADDVSGVLYQRVKLAIGADGAAADCPGDSTNGPYVQAKRRDLGKTRVSKRVAVSASQTGATVWDPTGGTKFVLTKLVYSATGAGTVQLFDETDSGNTVITPIMSVAANGGFVLDWPADQPYRSATADNILKYTSGSGAAGSLLVEGWEE